MSNFLILHMLVESGLKLMTPVSSDCMNSKRKFLNNIINKINGTLLVVTLIHFKGSNTNGIILLQYIEIVAPYVL